MDEIIVANKEITVQTINQFYIEKIKDSDVNETTDILTDVFKTNSAYSLIFQNKAQLEDGLKWLFKADLLRINHKQPLTNVVKEKDTGKILGTYTLIPPEGAKIPFPVYLKIGLPRFVFRLGVDPLMRMLDLGKFNKKLLTESMKVPSYWYLSMVAIRKEYQGKGIGTAVLQQAIRALEASHSTCKLLGLTTQLPENKVFYSRLGFDVLDEGTVTFRGDAYYNCTMKLRIGFI
ncbi:MAG: GNAT family N-acetyltransferase [Prevotellaceae bacterium]|jgi:GNAT superfamily N-acetyltransferase|nr:GNAT family N-acetyltransferase [Prevotellaceae bacterium]